MWNGNFYWCPAPMMAYINEMYKRWYLMTYIQRSALMQRYLMQGHLMQSYPVQPQYVSGQPYITLQNPTSLNAEQGILGEEPSSSKMNFENFDNNQGFKLIDPSTLSEKSVDILIQLGRLMEAKNCKLCQVRLNSSLQAQQHYRGKQHKTNLFQRLLQEGVLQYSEAQR